VPPAATNDRRWATVKYCITGGSGFIGSYFCETLAAAGHHLTILDLIEPPPGTPHDRFVKGDIRDAAACREALEGCDRLLHLAAAHHDFGIERATFFDVNEQGARVLCDAMDAHGVESVCFYSTVATYGEIPEPRHEDSHPEPVSPYGESKLAGEGVFKEWVERAEGRRCLVIRPTVTFGPRNFANMYTLIDQIHRGRFLIVGKGTNIKSLSYVENIVQASLFLWDKDDRPAHDVVNYIDKPDLTSIEITTAVCESLGRKLPPRLPFWLVRLMAIPFDLVIALTGKNLPVSSARVKKMFLAQTKYEADRVLASGFEPDATLREGIDRMVKWYLETGKDEEAEWHQPPAEPVMRAEGTEGQRD
jgi:nucleoside-diphosphate-sugar epimerase